METTKSRKFKLDEEPFYRVYIDNMSPLYDLKSGTVKSVLYYMCAHAEYNTGKISISPMDRDTISRTLGISKSMLSMALKELCAKRIISGSRGTYTINPQIFWKGTSVHRRYALESREFEMEFKMVPDQEKAEIAEDGTEEADYTEMT